MTRPLTTLLLIAMLCLTMEAQTNGRDFIRQARVPEAAYTPTQTTFSLVTLAEAEGAVVRLYSNDGTLQRTQPMTRQTSAPVDKEALSLWNASIDGDLNGTFYTFEVTQNGRALGETPGTRALAVGVNGKQAAVLDLNDTDPKGWRFDRRPRIPAKDLVIYEMHHRDFSIHPSGRFRHRGKYLALTEKRAIKHLKRLGVNAVHILPSFDYASVDETRLDQPQYNWGYDPVNYWVPEGSYSTNPYDPATRIREFKRMVHALHKAGIKVILDVVYNHTFDVGGSAFQHTMPEYFYRHNPDGTYSNGSGCGNETASERPWMRQYIIDCCRHWVDEYHIDGFRFDLMGIHDIKTMNAVRRALPPDIFIYGEGWAAGGCALPNEQLGMKANVSQMPGIAAFSDEIRDGLRGPWDGDDKAAFLGGVKGNEESIKFGLVGGIQHPQVNLSKVNYTDIAWAKQPTQLISYVSCHDDMCLTDRLRASIPGLTEEQLICLDLLAQTAVMTSQGVPFMLSGEEMLRNKKGVHNSYNSPDSINHLDWNNINRYPQVMRYYSRLIAMRKHHPAFRLGSADAVRRHMSFLNLPELMVGFCLKDHAGGDRWNNIHVILNANKTDQTVSIPQGRYTIVARDGEINERGLDKFEGNSVTVPAQSALIFHQ